MWRGFAQVPRSACAGATAHLTRGPALRRFCVLQFRDDSTTGLSWADHCSEEGSWSEKYCWCEKRISFQVQWRAWTSPQKVDWHKCGKEEEFSLSWTHKMLDVSRHLSCKLCSGGRMSQQQHTLHTSACSYDRVTSISRHNKCGVTKLCGRSHVLYRLWHCSLVHLINAQTNCAYLVRTEPRPLNQNYLWWVSGCKQVHSLRLSSINKLSQRFTATNGNRHVPTSFWDFLIYHHLVNVISCSWSELIKRNVDMFLF